MNNSSPHNPYSKKYTTEEGVDYLIWFLKEINKLNKSLYLFRGQRDDSWPLKPTSDRENSTSPEDSGQHLDEIIKDNLDLINNYKMRGYVEPNVATMAGSNLGILAHLRHLGAATLLLDFTGNALVALWFACGEDKNKDGLNKSKNKSKPTDGSVSALAIDDAGKYQPINSLEDVKKFSLETNLRKKITYYWQTALISNRIIAQNSYFVISGNMIEPDIKIPVPGDKKKAIRSALDKLMGINEMTLFPDEEGFALVHSQRSSYQETETGHAKMALSYYFSIDAANDKHKDKDKKSTFAIDNSIRHYNEVIKRNPNNPIAHNNLGLVQVEQGDIVEAINNFGVAIDKDSNFDEAYYNRGTVKSEQNQWREAINDYDKAIKINPQNYLAHNNRGLAQAKIGNYAEAILDYDEAIKIGPKNSGIYNSRGNAKYVIGKYADAILDYGKSIELNPKHSSAYSSRGNAKHALGNHTEAIKDYDKVIELDPKYALAYSNRGNAKNSLGNYAEAIKDYDKAINLTPPNSEIDDKSGIAKESQRNLDSSNITSLIDNRLRIITSLINKKLSTGPENESTEYIRIDDAWAEIFYMKVQEACKSCPLAVVVLCWPGYIKRQGMFLYEDDKKHWDWLTFSGSDFDAGLGTTGKIIASPYIRFYTRGKELTSYYIKDISLARCLFSLDNFNKWTGKHEKKDWDKLHDFLDSHLSGKPKEDWDERKAKVWKAIRDSDRSQINMSMSAEFYVRFDFNDLAKMEKEHNDEEVVQFYINVMKKMKQIVNDNKPHPTITE